MLRLIADYACGPSYVSIALTCRELCKSLSKYIPFRRPYVHIYFEYFAVAEINSYHFLHGGHWSVEARKIITQKVGFSAEPLSFDSWNIGTKSAVEEIVWDAATVPDIPGLIRCKIIPYAFKNSLTPGNVNLGKYFAARISSYDPRSTPEMAKEILHDLRTISLTYTAAFLKNFDLCFEHLVPHREI